MKSTTNSVNRINRMPITSVHKKMIFVVALAYFFEFADINTFSAVAPEIRRVWKISVSQVAYVTSISFVGMFLGSLVGGWLADKFGRKTSLVQTTVWFSAWSLATMFSWDIWSIGIFRFLTSAGLSAMTVIAVIYVNELFPANRRGKYLAYAMVIGICGTPVTTLLASFIVPINDWSWRIIFLWGALGGLVILGIKFLYESPVWLEDKKHFEEAEKVVSEIEEKVRQTGVDLPDPEAYVEPKVVSDTPPLRALFQKKYLVSVIVLSLLWITQSIGFFGYSSWAPTLLADQGISVKNSIFYVALTTVGAPFGSFLAALVTDRFERRWLLVFCGLIIGTCGLFYGFTFNPVSVIIFGFLVNLFERSYTSIAYAYSPETFDARTRSLGTGFTYGIGRLSNAAGPLIISGIYSASGYSSVFIFIAGTWFLGAIVLAIFGRSTKNIVSV